MPALSHLAHEGLGQWDSGGLHAFVFGRTTTSPPSAARTPAPFALRQAIAAAAAMSLGSSRKQPKPMLHLQQSRPRTRSRV
jgi:hypothetical protein